MTVLDFEQNNNNKSSLGLFIAFWKVGVLDLKLGSIKYTNSEISVFLAVLTKADDFFFI